MNNSVMLAVMTCQKCSPALLRHWPFFLRQGADWNYIITTTDQPCECPPNVHKLAVARDSYLDGAHLPKRMIDTLAAILEFPWRFLILAEYDCVFFKRIPVEKIECSLAAHLAGFTTWGSRANTFHHNPWVFTRDGAIAFHGAGQKVIDSGVCSLGSPESSPDVFFGLVCQEYDLPVQTDLWKEYSRNSFGNPVHLDEARQAYRDGWHCIHGLKTAEELEYITNG